jgi:hypothetical protein
MFSNNRDEYRKVFFDAWQKHKTQQILEPLEAQLIEIMLLHPEYHAILDNPETQQTKDFDSSNPFLHMSLHLGIREQVATNRPQGIREVYIDLAEKYQDIHVAEHNMMEYLAAILWEGQKNGKMPEEADYLEGLKKL